MQQKKTCLRRDGRTDLICDRETAATFETFFTKKNVDVAKEFRAIVWA
jgi:hypothetical protein